MSGARFGPNRGRCAGPALRAVRGVDAGLGVVTVFAWAAWRGIASPRRSWATVAGGRGGAVTAAGGDGDGGGLDDGVRVRPRWPTMKASDSAAASAIPPTAQRAGRNRRGTTSEESDDPNHDVGVGGTQRLASTISCWRLPGIDAVTDNRARVRPGVWSVTGTGDSPGAAGAAK